MTEQSVSRFHQLHMTGSWEDLEDTERSAEKVDAARRRKTCRAAVVKEADTARCTARHNVRPLQSPSFSL